MPTKKKKEELETGLTESAIPSIEEAPSSGESVAGEEQAHIGDVEAPDGTNVQVDETTAATTDEQVIAETPSAEAVTVEGKPVVEQTAKGVAEQTGSTNDTNGQEPSPAPEEGRDTSVAIYEEVVVPAEKKTLKKKKAPTDNAPRKLNDVNLKELDRYLTPEELAEWNAIYASYRSRSVLTGTVMGVDKNTYEVRNAGTGEIQSRVMYSAIIVGYRAKVLIPEAEMWGPTAQWEGHVLRGMVGAKMDYVILDIDREGGCAVASRRLALAERQRYFTMAPKGHEPGEFHSCQVMAVGPNRCLVECNGYDLSLRARDLTYTSISDLREEYYPGQELRCMLTAYDPSNTGIRVSVKLATSNPFDGAEMRHPVGSRRQATISGKYSGGVFVTMPDGVTVLCRYSKLLQDGDFQIEDNVIIAIEHYDFKQKLIAGRIMSKLR